MRTIFLAFILSTSIFFFAQTDTTYYNKNWQKCDKASAEYYRTIQKQGELYLVNDVFSKTNLPQMIAYCSKLEPSLEFAGKYILYAENGKKETEGNYVKNKRSGIWTFWTEGEQDSLVIDCNIDGTYKNIHIPASQVLNREMNVSYITEAMPEFPDKEVGLMKYLQKNIMYPQLAKDNGISGTCYVTFVVEKDGSVSDAKIIRGIRDCPECDEETLRLVNMMPKWKPGIQFGRAVRVQFNLPIKFYMK